MNLYFRRTEFACKCGCGFAAVDATLLQVLTDVREHFQKPVTITSGCRCPAHNKAVGGERESFHMKAMAADFKVQDIPAAVVNRYLQERHPGMYGIILYPTWNHVDVRPVPYRGSKV